MNVGVHGRLTIWHYDGDDQYAANVLYLLCDAKAGNGATQVQIIAAYAALYDPLIAPCMSSAATVFGMSFEGVPAGGPAITEVMDGTAGTSGANLLPAQVCGLIRLGTGLSGRTARGRKFIPFPSTTDADAGGNPTAGYLANLAALSIMFTSGFTAGAGANTNHFIPVIYHKATGNSTPVTDASVAAHFATQRRRSEINRPDDAPF